VGHHQVVHRVCKEISSPEYHYTYCIVFLQVLWTRRWRPTYKAETCSCILHIAPIWYCCVYWLYVYIYIYFVLLS